MDPMGLRLRIIKNEIPQLGASDASPTSRQDEGCWQAPVVVMCTSLMSQRKDWRGIMGGTEVVTFIVCYLKLLQNL